MCVVSMVMDHINDEWQRKYFPTTIPWKDYGPIQTPAPVPTGMPTQEEINELNRLIERAREYDRRNNEPDCELEKKKQKLKELADLLGVKIDFV